MSMTLNTALTAALKTAGLPEAYIQPAAEAIVKSGCLQPIWKRYPAERPTEASGTGTEESEVISNVNVSKQTVHA